MTPTAMAHLWFEEVWNKGDREAIDRLLAEPCEVTGLTQDPICDRDAMKAFCEQMNGALQDINIAVNTAVESENTVAVMFTVTATHRVTGKSFTQKNTCFAVVENDQIVRADNVVDFLSLFVQTGVLPADTVLQGLSADRIS